MADRDPADVTVGVVTYERPGGLRDLLVTLAGQRRLPAEVIVVDDSPDPEFEASVPEWTDRFGDLGVDFRYTADGPGSMPGARNAVIERATGRVTCFLDDDVLCPPGWLESILAGYGAFEDTAAVGGPAVTVDDSLEMVPDPLRDPRGVNELGEYGAIDMAADRWIPPEPVECDLLMGANMSFRTDRLRAVGGFDAGYGGTAAHEDSDVMARLAAAGERAVYHPGALVYHCSADAGGSRASLADRREWYYWLGRNAVRFRWLNFRDSFARSVLDLLLSGDGVTASLQEQVATAVRTGDGAQLWWTWGYLHGLAYETVRADTDRLSEPGSGDRE